MGNLFSKDVSQNEILKEFLNRENNDLFEIKTEEDDFISVVSASDCGLKRDVQEDSTLCVFDQAVDSVLVGVADGMGGHGHGDYASGLVVSKLEDWFRNERTERLNNFRELTLSLLEAISRINDEINNSFSASPGSTLSLALVNENIKKTLIVNIGDSRVYSYKEADGLFASDEFSLLTDDNSVTFPPGGRNNGDRWLDNYRYRVSNVITNCIGVNSTDNNIKACSQIIEIPNSYQKLLLASDGITDLVAHSRIRKLMKQCNNDIDLVKRLIYYSLYGDDKKLNYGKDNATGLVLTRKK